ncbi:MAG: redox-sensing transcriptional repressor Rex [Candidatus Coatesbacteria bacterium]|nr:redox-sensing transcriptional repressor Rex [Candidatus Coatesbacteria bacterium]
MNKTIPQATVRRLSLYCRFLEQKEREEQAYISSQELGAGIGTNAAQVRKDLCFFDRFGTPGRGYPVGFLRRRLAAILGIKGQSWRVAVVGVGKLGAALVGYGGFNRQGFDFVALLDNDPDKLGRRYGGLDVEDAAELETILRRREVDIVILTVPAAVAQRVLDRVVDAGIRAVLNFAPTTVNAPPGIQVRNVDLAVELEGLSFFLINYGRD